MKKGLLGILAAGLMTSAANAGILNLRFAGGATEITMDQASNTATIEVVLNLVAGVDKAATQCTGVNLRFDVGSLAPSDVPGQSYVLDNGSPDKFSVTSVSTTVGSWNTGQSLGVPGEFHRDSFYLAAGHDGGSIGPTGGATSSETVIASFNIHKDTFLDGDTYIVFRVESPLPAVYGNNLTWTQGWASATGNATLNNQWDLGTGNPGTGDPRWAAPTPGFYRNQETISPLVIHNVPEPGALALLALGGLATLRRRK